jgi:molybdopterin molybdotransferase
MPTWLIPDVINDHMKEFFKVQNLDQVFRSVERFAILGTEKIDIVHAFDRILAEKITADVDLPAFTRSTMDGYAVKASSSFGASEANPGYLELVGSIAMGSVPLFEIGPGQAAKISTGGMLPKGSDAVVMLEHTDLIDDNTIEVHRSVAPGQHVIARGEDFNKDEIVLTVGRELGPPEIGLLAAFGKETVTVFKKPSVAIISTGDEIVPVSQQPKPGHIRDINSYTLAGLVRKCGGEPLCLGIVPDHFDALFNACSKAIEKSDMIMISGGSSVGTRDFTINVFSSLPHADILVHGISISPGKPTILGNIGGKPCWGLPGHVVSAMVVFSTVVKPFLDHISGRSPECKKDLAIKAVLKRNISSTPGRTDYVRVKLIHQDDTLFAEPLLGKSGLINTMVHADGMIEIDINTEGLDKGEMVNVLPV